MSGQSTLRFWLLSLVAALVVLWLFSPVLLPFLAGLAVAYFLEPAVSALEARKVPRGVGALVVLSLFLFLIVALLLLLWPLLVSQGGALLAALPDTLSLMHDRYLPWAQHWLERFSPQDVEKLRDAAAKSTGAAVGWFSQTLRHIVSSGVAFIDAVALSILTPVTAYYVLHDWHKLTRVIDDLIPRRSYAVVREQMGQIDATLSGFLRGQALVCLVLGVVYSVGLASCGLEYGVTVGLIAGVLTIIPYVGTVFGWMTSVLLAFVQFDGDWLRIGAVVGVFVVGHLLEGYVLTPRFVGNRVGLHPVWILFALIAGAKLMGFSGVLIAVPSAAVLGVLVRFGVRQYKASAVYKA